MRTHRSIVALLTAALLSPATHAAAAQGRCIRAYGTPACNTDSISPVFARTGWRTTSLDHIAFRVADPQKEAAFYAALMGWKVRSDDGTRVVMDIGDWGTAVFRQAPADSFPPPRSGRANAVPVRAVVEGFGFDIEPWNAKTVEAELRKRGLNPVADNDGEGIRELSREGSRRLRRCRSGTASATRQARARIAGERRSSRDARAVRVDGMANRVARSSLVRRDELQGERRPSTSTCWAGARRTTREARTS